MSATTSTLCLRLNNTDDCPEFRYSDIGSIGSFVGSKRLQVTIPSGMSSHCEHRDNMDCSTRSSESNSAVSNKLYARQVEQERLVQSYKRCGCGKESGGKQPELVVITGPSGTGKSQLALSLQPHVLADKGFLVAGKFDQLERPETSYPLVRAVTDLIQQLCCMSDLNNDSPTFLSLQDIGNTESLLVDMIPVLKRFQKQTISDQEGSQVPKNDSHQAVGEDEEPTSINHHQSADAPKLLALGFCRLIKAICNPSRPIVLFLDDIQWAKPAPLEIVSALLTDQELIQRGGFMMLAACRGNEVSTEHHLSVTFRELEATGVNIVDIRLGNLPKEAVHDMVRDNIPLTNYKATQLAQHIWDQTQGNCLFTMLFIRKIRQEYLQTTCLQNADSYPASPLPNQITTYHSAIELIAEMISNLPKNVQEVLKVASCFGAEFHSSLLQKLIDTDVREALRIAQAEQLIIISEGVQETSSSFNDEATWRFHHDQIQASAYALIPTQDHGATHLHIGRRLWNELNEEELQTFGFAVVRQIRLGSHLLTDVMERYQVADLLLKAGIHALRTSSFDEAASHFELGISLLALRHWKDEYILSLELYLGAAKAAYCTGNQERVRTLTDEVIQNARNNRDRLKAYIARIEILGSTNQAKLALQLCLAVLKENGYRIPKKGSIPNILYQFVKTKRKLKRQTIQRLRSMPLVDDEDISNIMRILSLALLYSVYADPMLFPVLTMIAVRTVLKTGMCGASAIPLAAFSMLLCSQFGDVDLGYRLARLSVDVVKATKGHEWRHRVHGLVHGFVFVIKDSLASQFVPLLVAHRRAILLGDIEWGMIVAQVSCAVGLQASLPLKPLIADMTAYLKMMQVHCQTSAMLFLLPTFQSALNLVHESDDPAEFNGEVLKENHFLEVQAVDNPGACAAMKVYKMMVACIFREYRIGEALARDAPNWPVESFTPFVRVAIFLYAGVCHAALAGSQTKQRLRMVKKILRGLKRFVRSSEGRYDPQILILEAEVAGMNGKVDAAVNKFERAIKIAQGEGLHILVGLASERASLILLNAYRNEEANDFLIRAAEAFQSWGADAKLKRMIPLLPAENQKPFVSYLKQARKV